MSDLCWQALRALPRWLWLLVALPVVLLSPQQLPALLIAAGLAWVWSRRRAASVAGFSGCAMSLLAVVLMQQHLQPFNELLLATLAIGCGVALGISRRPQLDGQPLRLRATMRPRQRSQRAVLAFFGILLVVALIHAEPPALAALVLVLLIVAIELSGDAPRVLAVLGIGLALLGFFGALFGENMMPLAPLLVASVFLAQWRGQGRWRVLGCALLVGLAAAYYAEDAHGLQWLLILLPPAMVLLWWQMPGCGPGLQAAIRSLPPSWRWFVWAKRRWDPLRRQLLADPRPWGRILDAGCGWGLGGTVAWEHAGSQSYVGIDLDALKLGVAAHLLESAPLPITLQRVQLPAPLADQFDTIFACDILHYWPPEAQLEMLRWLRSHLDSDGVLWLREGLSDAQGAARVTWGERWTTAIGLNPRGGLHFLSEDALRQHFAAAGLRVCSCQASGGANRLWELMAEEAA